MDEEGTRALLDTLAEGSSRGDLLTRNNDIMLREKEDYNIWKDQMMAMLESENMTGTRALLDTLAERSSRGDLLTRNIDIMLREKEDYNIWKDQMMAMLESENMTGFVDGSLTDPDPKGESQDERVRKYSEKWKKLDKELMEWIRDSLDDTLKGVVKESKTSEDICTYLGTRALLDTVAERSSRGDLLTRNIDIMLHDKENYNPWMKQMKEMLKSENLIGFVDGSLRDPDPKGESQEEHVRLYSEKWKKLDKELMEWIRDSLDYTLKGVVKESKTSEDICTYLGTRALLDTLAERSSRGDLLTRDIDIMLHDKENYNPWMEQMKEMLKSENMIGFVDGSLRDPDPKGESQEEHVRLYSEKWKKLDKELMEWIRDSLDDTLKGVVKESKTSEDICTYLGTRAHLDSLEQSIGIRRERTIDSNGAERRFMLCGQENYKHWSRKMRESIIPQSMFCFIDGSLKVRDPEGVSEDKDVVKYSKKWKKFDKRVMKWIMDALNDILNYMVEEMKTSKDMWETLEIFFSEEVIGPLDSNSIPKLQDETNYNEWKEKTDSFMVNKKMGGFIDGTFRDPSKISRSIWQKYKPVVKKFSERWTLLDQLVMTLIKSSLSVELQDIVKDLKTSKEFRHALEILFTGYPDHIPVNEANFLSIKLSGKENYIQWAQQIKCLLEMHGLQNLIDPLSRQPPASFGNHKGWKEYSKLLKGWIFNSLTQNVLDTTLTKIPTATGLWGEIKNRYGPLDVEKTRLEDEYRTRELLDSFEVSISTDKSVTDTSSIILTCGNIYQTWRDEMLEFLNSKRMKGFIDGTLRYPDPTGESEEEHVRTIYIKKWKRFDKQVMKWIRDSLTDILKYMVGEMKTSKDMWDTLKTFFTTDPEALLPSLKDSDSHGEGVLKTLDIKLLDKDNYQPWRDEMMEFLDLRGMKGFIDGTFRDPGCLTRESKTALRRMFYSEKWKRFDKQVMEWIMDSLTDIFKYMVQGMETSKEMWETLVEFFTRDTGALLASLKDSLSHGDGVMNTFDNKLLGKENYQFWCNDMMKFLGSQGIQQQGLDSKGMKGFIDGTLIDPDPKGESEDKDVRMYSKIWKRLDKQVMEWIMTSLNDTGILNYMVEKMKTSKELWGNVSNVFL